jgi:hypothetical protein
MLAPADGVLTPRLPPEPAGFQARMPKSLAADGMRSAIHNISGSSTNQICFFVCDLFGEAQKGK